MSAQEFSSLPLHDAILQSIELLWKEKLCRLHLTAAAQKGEAASGYLLEFQHATILKVPQEEPWGRSCSVNSASHSGGSFHIQMQSGDVIEIVAHSFIFAAI